MENLSKGLGPVWKSLIILGIYAGGGAYAKACEPYFGDVLASARVSEGASYDSVSEQACTTYAIFVPSRLKVSSKYSKNLISALSIGATTYCYKNEQLMGYGYDRSCKRITRVQSYYSAILSPGQVIELEVVDGYGSVTVLVEGGLL